MSRAKHPVLTIGHSTHALDDFTALLRQHEVTAVADVRSVPYSRFSPQFNRDALAGAIEAQQVKYVFLGRELGARSEDRSCYVDGRVSYARLAHTDAFARGIERVLRGTAEHRVALMCAEREPLECHRTLLVARVLADRGVEVQHILGDGRVEAHQATMERLLDIVGLPRRDLFRSRAELLAEALAVQEERVAFVATGLAADGTGDAP